MTTGATEKVQYMPLTNPSENEVDLTYVICINLSSMIDKHHLGMTFLRKKKKGDLAHPRTNRVVQSGIAKYRDSLIPKHVHEDLATGKCKKLILNYSNEGYHDVDWDYISTIFGVEQSKIIWITSVWNPKVQNSQSDITVVYSNFWERFVWGQVNQGYYNSQIKILEECSITRGYKQQIQDIKDLKIRKYYGLNYNRQPHIHRAYLLTKLKQEELLDRTAYSWGGREQSHEIWDDQRIEELLERGKKFKYLMPRDDESFREILKSKQITFPNEELKTNKAHSINFDHVSLAYFQIITETNVDSNSNDPYLSEKSYKSFISCMPFVMWGNAFTIGALRNKGYHCYETWINQSYDRIADNDKRLEALITEIKRLYTIPPEQWSIMLKEMLPTIEHNRKRLYLNSKDMDREFELEPDILRFIL